MRKRRALPTQQARKTIIGLAKAGWTVYAIVRYMNKHRFKPPRGRSWNKEHVNQVLRAAAVEPARGHKATSPDALEIILDTGHLGVSLDWRLSTIIKEAIKRLEDAGLRPAHGGPWRDSVVRRLLERHLGLTSKKLTDEERFQRSVVHDPATDCDLWRGSMQDGRGKFEVGGKPVLAYRWHYEFVHGPGSIPTGYHLHHECGRERCVSVGHLMPVASSEHRRLELEEAEINTAALDGTLRAELDELAANDDPIAWPPIPAGSRVGVRRMDRAEGS